MSDFEFADRALPRDVPQVMGILNITRDSFSDGGELLKGGKPAISLVIERAAAMVSDGASILDLGGESTRPGAEPVSSTQELDRVLPALEALRARFDVVLSLDTSNPVLIKEGAALGAHLVNDVRALSVPGALDAARLSGLPVCLMHMQGQPGTMQKAPVYQDVVQEVADFLVQRAADCIAAGIPAEKIMLDPGFGFGKTFAHNLTLLRHIATFTRLPYPVLAGVSRKKMLGEITGKPEKERIYAGIGAAVIAVMQGAWIIRTHDVAATVDALKVIEQLGSTGSSNGLWSSQ